MQGALPVKESSLGEMLVVNGPAFGGREQVITMLLEEFPQMYRSPICHTSRSLTDEEKESTQSVFMDHAALEAMISDGLVLEHAVVGEDIVCTSKASVTAVTTQGYTSVIGIPAERTKCIKKGEYMATYVYIGPTSMEALEQILSAKGLMEKYDLEEAREQMKYVHTMRFYDLTIIEDSVDEAYLRLCEFLGRESRKSGEDTSLVSKPSEPEAQEQARDWIAPERQHWRQISDDISLTELNSEQLANEEHKSPVISISTQVPPPPPKQVVPNSAMSPLPPPPPPPPPPPNPPPANQPSKGSQPLVQVSAQPPPLKPPPSSKTMATSVGLFQIPPQPPPPPQPSQSPSSVKRLCQNINTEQAANVAPPVPSERLDLSLPAAQFSPRSQQPLPPPPPAPAPAPAQATPADSSKQDEPPQGWFGLW